MYTDDRRMMSVVVSATTLIKVKKFTLAEAEQVLIKRGYNPDIAHLAVDQANSIKKRIKTTNGEVPKKCPSKR